MEVRIGIKDSPRELMFETEQTAADVRKLIEDAIANDAALISLTDTKGNEFLIATRSVAYAELGGAAARKVGFIN